MISNNFGTQYLVTLTPSKNANNLDCGKNPFPSKATFLDLIVGIISVLIVLSPRDVWSNCSVINCLEPSLDSIPVLNVSVNVSWKVVVVVVSISFHSFPEFFLVVLLPVTSFLFVTVLSFFVPVQEVCQPPQTIGVNPVCGSKPPYLLSAVVITSAKLPSVSKTLASSLTVLTQVSVSGVNFTNPCQKLRRNGVTLSDLVPQGWLRYSASS